MAVLGTWHGDPMNLHAAVALCESSGRSFKRRTWDDFMWCNIFENDEGCQEVMFATGVSLKARRFVPLASDLVAGDYEMESEKVVPLTHTLFMDAVRDVQTSPGCMVDATKLRLRLGL